MACIVAPTAATAKPGAGPRVKLVRWDRDRPPLFYKRLEGGTFEDKTDYVFDYRARVIETTRYPRSGKILSSKNHYVDNELFYTEDPYGRREYMGYRTSDGQLIRRIQAAEPNFTLTDNSAVLNKVRDNTTNAPFVIADAIKDGAGLSVAKLGGGTYNISISAVISKLADTPANGGASVTFGAGCDGAATVTVSPEEEISVTIVDGMGRTVCSAQIESNKGSNPNAIISWSCTQYDQTATVTGFGTVLQTVRVSPDGDQTKTLTDGAGRTLQQIDALGKITSMDYDAAGNVTKLRDPNNVGYDAVYDNLGRQTSRTDTQGDTVTTTYDLAGRLASESLTYASQTYTVSREYDTEGRVNKLTYPDGSTVERTYTARGQLEQLKYNGSVIDTRVYDDGGRMTTSTYGNGVVNTYTYRQDNLVSSIEVKDSSNTVLDKFTYSFDANKSTTTETRTGVMSNYGWSTGATGYDDEDRLVSLTRDDNNLSQSWTLTSEGDWSQFVENTNTENRTHGAAHELTAIGSTALSYDPKGNLTVDNTKNHSYTWDFDNRMSAADTDGDNTDDVTLKYDALGRRIAKTSGTNAVVYVSMTQPIAYSPFAGQVVAEYASGAAPSSPTEKYVYASYIDEPVLKDGTGGTVYYHRNSQYSASALTSASGAVVERYAYEPYGELTILAADGSTVRTSSSYANSYTYTGRRWDSELKLYYFRARYYDPALGRFVGRASAGTRQLVQQLLRGCHKT